MTAAANTTNAAGAGVSLSRGDLGRALGVVLIWGTNFVAMKLALQEIGPMMLGALRFGLASLPFLLFIRRPALPWRYMAAYGLAQGLGQFGLLFLGLKLGMTAGMASVVMQTQAFFTLLLAAPLLGERARRQQWIGLTVALAGLMLIGAAHGDGPGQMTLIGFLLTLGAGFMWALSNIVARFATRHAPAGYDPFGFVVWSSLTPVIPFVLIAMATEGGPSVIAHQLARLDLAAMISVLYLAWFATLLAYSMWTRLLQRHPAGRVVPFSLLVPVVGLTAAALSFGERPNVAQWAGTAAVLLGLMINQGLGLRRGLRAM